MDINNEFLIGHDILNYLEIYCGQEIANKWSIQQKRYNHKDKIIVVNTGLINVGKSALFDALIEQKDGDIKLVDTLGIDLKQEGNRSVQLYVLAADIIVMVHDIKLGPLTEEEVTWIKHICSYYNNSKELKRRLLFICSDYTQVSIDKTYKTTIKEMKKALYGITKARVDFMVASPEYYTKGLKENKRKLIRQSNIKRIQKKINAKARRIKRIYGKGILTKGFELLYDTTYDHLEEQLNNKKQLTMQYIASIDQQYLDKKHTWQSMYEVLVAKEEQVRKLKEEYNMMLGK